MEISLGMMGFKKPGHIPDQCGKGYRSMCECIENKILLVPL